MAVVRSIHRRNSFPAYHNLVLPSSLEVDTPVAEAVACQSFHFPFHPFPSFPDLVLVERYSSELESLAVVRQAFRDDPPCHPS